MLTLWLAACAVLAQPSPAPETKSPPPITSTDASDANPRNTRFVGPVIEFLTIEPRTEVHAIGDRPALVPGKPRTLTVRVRNLSDTPADLRLRWLDVSVELPALAPAAAATHTFTIEPDRSPFDSIVHLERRRDSNWELADTAETFGPEAMRVAVLVDQRSFDAAEARFGSFSRRLRKSLDDLHELFDQTNADDPADLRPPVADRFRLEHVEFFDSAIKAQHPLFVSHPTHDIVIAVNENAGLCCFWLPQYSIGHDFYAKHLNKGIWSDFGEQALWHELIHFRGVPDFYIYDIPKEALPSRATAHVGLPEIYRRDIMNSPYQPPRISFLTASIMNSKRGVSRVGACEEPDHPFGHQWTWTPRRLSVRLTQHGKPLPDATIRWFRSRPMDFRDPRMQGVPADAAPDATLTTSPQGLADIEGDYLGRADPRHTRSLWLLIEVTHDAKRRFAVVSGLWLNERFARGDTDHTTLELDFDALTIIP